MSNDADADGDDLIRTVLKYLLFRASEVIFRQFADSLEQLGADRIVEEAARQALLRLRETGTDNAGECVRVPARGHSEKVKSRFHDGVNPSLSVE